MQILYWFESIRAPWLDAVMLALSELAGETVFLVAALILYWCVDKRKAYFLMSIGFIGTIANQFLKITCRVLRPWYKDPDFTIVEAARDGATGYSFPSGHSQTAVGIYGALSTMARHKWLRGLCVAVMVLVPISRMYLGVHTPSDVLVGAGMALLLIGLIKPLFDDPAGKHLPKLFIGMLLLSAAHLAYVELFPFPADTQAENLASARENAYTLFGAMSGAAVMFSLDRRNPDASVQAVWYAQILKVLGGLIVVLAVMEGLKAPINMLFHGHLFARSVRYFLVVLAAGVLWPKTFPYFAKLGGSK